MLERDTPRMATSGALMIGVNAVPPMPRRLEMVKQPPCISAAVIFFSRARALTSPSSFASCTMPFWSTSRITGTTRPSGVSTATPMWMYFFTIRFSPLASSEALKSGKCLSVIAQALSMKASGVILMFCLAYSAPSSLRKASISLMSASSNCVTCGIITQLRCRFAPEIFLMRDSGLASTAPNLAKSTSGHGSRPGSAPPPEGAPPPASDFLTKFCTSSLVMRPLGALPLTRVRSTPSSRANRRMDGLACALPVAETAGAACAAGATAATAGAGATGAAAAGTGAAAAADACVPAPLASISAIRSPSDTLSPTFTFISFTTPSNGAGTSMVALSVSSEIRACSAETLSPALTATSMTLTPLKLPMSGTVTCLISATLLSSRLNRHRVRLVGVDLVLLDRLAHLACGDNAFIGQCLQCGNGDVVAIHLEEVAQFLARVGTAETIGAQRLVLRFHEGADLVGVGTDIVGRGDHRRLAVQALSDIARTGFGFRMQCVPALAIDTVAAQLVEAGHAPDVGSDAEILLQQLGGCDHFAQDGTAAEQLHFRFRLGIAGAELVHALDDAFLGALRHGRMGVVLVHHREVIEHVFLLVVHALHAVLYDHRQLVGEGRVVGDAVGDGGGNQVAVAVLVLQAFAVQRGAAGGAADQEAARAQVARRPGQVADTLEAEHRVVDVERDHRHAVVGVSRCRSDPVGHAASLIDAFLQDLAGFGFLVVHQLVGVLRRIELAHLREDAELT